MAVNQSHSENRRGASIPAGESLLNQCAGVELSFPQQPPGSSLFSGTKKGTVYLTSYRVIFVTSHSVSDPMLSFMMPFNLMKNCTVEQPAFGPNYISGTIQADPEGGWEGQATFKLVFRKGGAIDFARLLTEATSAAFVYAVPPTGHGVSPGAYGAPPPGYGAPPPGYGVPFGGYGAPPPGYGAPPGGYGVPPPEYRGPPGGYGATSPAYGAPPPGYEAAPGAAGSPPPRYKAPPATYRAPASAPEAPPAASGAGHPSSAAAPPPGYEASLPSTSSPQAPSPPSKM
ncbi:postacrosomal sheath WW domain-binding protein [Ctenodactylus gundi]